LPLPENCEVCKCWLQSAGVAPSQNKVVCGDRKELCLVHLSAMLEFVLLRRRSVFRAPMLVALLCTKGDIEIRPLDDEELQVFLFIRGNPNLAFNTPFL